MAKELCSQTCVFNVLRTILFVLHLSANGLGFNLQATRNDIIYAPNKNVQQKRGGMEEPSNFFGYDFALQKDGDTNPPSITLLIGSPKDARESQIPTVRKSPVPETESKTKPGNIFSCQLTLFEDGEKSSSCISVAPEPDRYDVKSLTKEDSLGLRIVKGSPRRGQSTPTHQVLSCAPLRQTNCTTTYLTAGICYSSEDFGRSWEESKQPTRSCPTQKLDMMLVLDGSGSVTNDDPLNFDRVKDWVKKIAQSFDLSEFARMGVVQYSHWYKNRDVQPYIKTEIKLGAFNNPRDLEIALDKVTIQGYTTYTAHAINKTVQDFQESDRFEDPATKKVMVLLTDGRSNDSPQLEYSAAYARSLGITIFAVGVGGYSTKELQLMATGELGNNKRVYGLRKFSDLQKIVDSLQKSITGILEGGTTVNETNGLQSSETGIGGFIAKQASSSLLWEKIVDKVSPYNVEKKISRFVTLRTPKLAETFRNPYFGQTLLFSEGGSDNPRLFVGAPYIISMKTKTSTGSDIVKPIPKSIVWSNGGDVNSGKVLKPPGYKLKKFYKALNTLHLMSVSTVGKSVTMSSNGGIIACSPNHLLQCQAAGTAFYHGICYEGKHYGDEWTDIPKFQSNDCPVRHIDIMFVIDGSRSVNADHPDNFQIAKNWVRDITSKLDITENGIASVGVVQYSHYYKNRKPNDQPAMVTEVQLGQYKDMKSFSKALDRIEPQGLSTFTAHALLKTVKDFEGSPRYKDAITKKVLILVTDGQSNDGFMLRRSSNFVRSLNITCFAVGVKDALPMELQIVANGKIGNNERVFSVSNYASLNAIAAPLLDQIRQTVLEGENVLSLIAQCGPALQT